MTYFVQSALESIDTIGAWTKVDPKHSNVLQLCTERFYLSHVPVFVWLVFKSFIFSLVTPYILKYLNQILSISPVFKGPQVCLCECVIVECTELSGVSATNCICVVICLKTLPRTVRFFSSSMLRDGIRHPIVPASEDCASTTNIIKT